MDRNLSSSLSLDQDYKKFLFDVKTRLKHIQFRTASAVNQYVIQFYWRLGSDILQLQSRKKRWGNKFIEQLALDLNKTYSGLSGFSKRNLEYMRALARLYPSLSEFTQQAAAQLPWSHIQLLLDKFRDNPEQREWYAAQVLKHGWSRGTLGIHIKSNLYERQGISSNKISNYQTKLPSPQSDLAQEILKDPYNFDFLTISQDAHENEIERALITHIRDFLLELGAGFSFIGTQVNVEIDGETFFIDALFYHIRLRCFVVCEIKTKKFKPADLGQLSFYLAAVDAKFKHESDNPTIGILLCESHSKIIAEYALRNINAPIGVSEYLLRKSLPQELKSGLPSIEAIEAELNAVTT